MQEVKLIRHLKSASKVQFTSIVDAWEELVSLVALTGEKVSPRGMSTLEVSNISYQYTGPYQYTFVNSARNFNPVYWLVELFFFLNKRDDDLRENFIKSTSVYKNPDTQRYDGSYTALGRYLPYVISLLQKDPDTRRAVITTLDASHMTNADRTMDMPCNNLFMWRIRDGALDMNVVTRSQDLYIGWIMNTLGFQLLQLMLAKALSLETGVYSHYIGSLHLYEEHIEKAKDSIGQTETDTWKPELVDWSVNKFWDTVRLVNSFSEYPALFGAQYDGFQDDILKSIQIHQLRHKDIAPTGGYSRWVKKWVEEKKK